MSEAKRNDMIMAAQNHLFAAYECHCRYSDPNNIYSRNYVCVRCCVIYDMDKLFSEMPEKEQP